MKHSLISTTSFVAILSTIGSGAFAGSVDLAAANPVVVPPIAVCLGGRTLDLRAGMLRSDNVWADDVSGSDNVWADDVSGTNISDKLGLGDAEGGFVSGQFTWDRCGSDIAVGAGFGSTSMEETEQNESARDIAISDDVDFQFFDVDYGRPIADMARVFAGLRVLNFESNSAFSDELFAPQEYISGASFTGVGPRAGAEFNTSSGQAGAFGVFGGASAALLFGERKNELTFDDGALISKSETSSESVLNFEAELGVSYNISAAAAVKLGMNYIQINDMDWASGSDFVSDYVDDNEINDVKAGDRSFIGAFVGLEIAF
jgi:opacity protein-like surface antigen